MFQVFVRRRLREVWVLLHLTGECNTRVFASNVVLDVAERSPLVL